MVGYYSCDYRQVYLHSLVIFLLLILFVSNIYASEVVIATGINNDPPYVYSDKQVSDEFPGVTIDVLRLIEEKSDMKFIVKKRPWKRVVVEVKGNLIDGGFHFSYKEKRKSFVAYPIPEGHSLPDPKYSISNRSYTLYRLKGQTIHWNGKQIVANSKENHVISAIRGGSITQDIRALGHELVEVNDDLQLIQGLLLKRVDAFVALENMLDPKIEMLSHNERELIEKSLPEVVNKPYYIAFSKSFYRDNPEKAWKVWKTIDLIKKSGELQKIFYKYANR